MRIDAIVQHVLALLLARYCNVAVAFPIEAAYFGGNNNDRYRYPTGPTDLLPPSPTSITQQHRQRTPPNHPRPLSLTKRNDDDDDPDKAPLDTLDTLLSILSTPISIPALPGPPLPLSYIITLVSCGVLLPGPNPVTLIGASSFLFALFLTLGRTLAYDEEDYDGGDIDGDDTDGLEATGGDIIALGGAIVSTYLLLPPELPTAGSDGGGGALPFLLVAAGGLLFLVGFGADDDGRGRARGGGEEEDPSRRLMDLWDERFGDGDDG